MKVCGKKYTRKEHLANHMRSHTNDTPFRCEICGKAFTRKEHFTNHIMWHTGETPHRCDFCSKTFTRKEHLLNHVRQHTGESPHRCGYVNIHCWWHVDNSYRVKMFFSIFIEVCYSIQFAQFFACFYLSQF